MTNRRLTRVVGLFAVLLAFAAVLSRTRPDDVTNASRPVEISPGVFVDTGGSDVAQPKHDWTVTLFGRSYGVTQWGDSDCSVVVGHLLITLGVPAAQVALVASFLAGIVLGGGAFLWWRGGGEIGARS